MMLLTDAEICKKRTSFRTKKGGHNVPDADVERRFYRSVRNFWKTYQELANTAVQKAIEENRKMGIPDEVQFER